MTNTEWESLTPEELRAAAKVARASGGPILGAAATAWDKRASVTLPAAAAAAWNKRADDNEESA